MLRLTGIFIAFFMLAGATSASATVVCDKLIAKLATDATRIVETQSGNAAPHQDLQCFVQSADAALQPPSPTLEHDKSTAPTETQSVRDAITKFRMPPDAMQRTGFLAWPILRPPISA
ncbi:MAG: hypothetical protein AAFP99_10425 [Pseudomonadota bacterium]